MSASGRSRRLSCCSWRLCTCSGACDLTRTQKHKQWRRRRRRNLPPRLLQVLPRGDSPRGPVAQGAAQSLPRFLETNARCRVEQGSCYQRERQGGGRRPTNHLRGGPGSTGSRPRCSVQQLELQSLCRRVAVNLNRLPKTWLSPRSRRRMSTQSMQSRAFFQKVCGMQREG